ncbi:hypothetical protein DPMN_027525 [Dreissena polymorpha]|uniref:Uncharacterized protein n=1 Tax=Dreissena polymorpha TaxID=45954 RepID=A0A9D4LUI4_DREPO|nr:hypothetical protein DPMN_027525 [Dreissena polymorpha]
MQYAAKVAPVQPAHPSSLVKLCILRRNTQEISRNLVESVALEQTVQARRLDFSHAGCICNKTNSA